MRKRAVRACLALCVIPGAGHAAEGGALPGWFQESWDVVSTEPLTIFPVSRLFAAHLAAEKASARKIAADDLTAERIAADRQALLSIMTAGIPTPPDRPLLIPTATSYASLTPDIGPGDLSDPVPLPIRRPLTLDQEAGADAQAQPAIPRTKIAMLGAMPGAGMAIGALARLEPVAPIVKGSCSVDQPYRVTALGPSGRTELQPAATLDYPMVEGLVRWEDGMQAAARRLLGEPVVKLHVAASYDCRTMNHRRRARLSEHAHANAIDISEYETASGKKITVAADFHSSGPKGDFLRQIHANTCDVFQVVLGPGSDGMHEDHFHMDLGHWKACR